MEIAIKFNIGNNQYLKNNININFGKFDIDIKWKLSNLIKKLSNENLFINNNQINICCNSNNLIFGNYDTYLNQWKYSQEFNESILKLNSNYENLKFNNFNICKTINSKIDEKTKNLSIQYIFDISEVIEWEQFDVDQRYGFETELKPKYNIQQANDLIKTLREIKEKIFWNELSSNSFWINSSEKTLKFNINIYFNKTKF